MREVVNTMSRMRNHTLHPGEMSAQPGNEISKAVWYMYGESLTERDER